MLNMIPFGNACTLQNGKAFKPSDWSNSGIPIVRIQNLNDESKPFNYCETPVEERFHIDSGDLLFSWSGTPGTSFGAFFWNRGEAYLNQHIFKVDVDENEVNKNYLRYAINSKLIQIIDQAHGGVGLKHITKGKLEAIEIPLPPLPEQKRIAAILDKADAIRRKRQQAIDLADEFLRSVFLEMFGDPVTNPKGWDTNSLGALFKIGTGGTPSRKNDKFYGGRIPWVKTTEVKGTDIFETEETITDDAVSSSNCKIYPKYSIILAMYGQGKTRGQVGRLMIDAATNQACAIIQPSENMNMEYVYKYLMLSYDTLRELGRGGNQPNLNLSIVKDFKIMCPPKDLQKKISDICKQTEKIKKRQLTFLEASNDQFNSLSKQAFAGKL